MKPMRGTVLGFVLILGCLLVLPTGGVGAATYTVDTTSDASLTACTAAAADCSLRGAITNANAASTPGDLINFDPAVFNPGVINIASPLPDLSGGGDTIDATGATVTVDGAGQTFYCFFIASAGNTVKGLRVTDCTLAILLTLGATANTVGPGNVLFANTTGVVINDDSSGNIVIGNKIGTNAGGTAVAANSNGVELDGDNNTVGGANAADRNIISGNSTGIRVGNQGSGNTIRGNYIGTDVTGTADLGNTFGLDVQGPSNIIGGTNPGEPNLISGNAAFNLRIVGEDADSNLVRGNMIGPDVNGSGAVMNCCSAGDVVVQGGPDSNTIGPGNIISDGSFGIIISDPESTGNVVKGNLIGTNPAGTAAVPNTGTGVLIDSSSGNTIGGTNTGDGNMIAFNGGVGVFNFQGTQNRIRGNSIHDNASSPQIDNSTGGNFELAPPTITAAGANAVSGTACANCEVDVFSDGASDAEFYEGSATANGSGQWVLYTSLAGPNVTATNTDATGNTSELSAAVGFTATDTDGDGVPDSLDNCSAVANADQADTDGDGLGNACDADDDNDTLADGSDNCPAWANPSQAQPNWPIPPGDSDCDGFSDSVGQSLLAPETYIGTDPARQCASTSTANDESGMDRWPMDFNDNRLANGQDFLTFIFSFAQPIPGSDITVPIMGTFPPERWDFTGNGIINGQDFLKYINFFAKSCSLAGS